MQPRHRVSRAAIELIKRFEGYRQTAAQLPDGRWTIGYGHTLTARAGASVNEPDAEALLLYDLIAVSHGINEAVYAPLGRNQFDALCSFTFNLGLNAFRGSQVLRRLNAGEVLQAAYGMELWRKAEFDGDRIVVDALVRRRAAEKALFLTPDDGVWTPSPSTVLRPILDLDALELVPLRPPQVLHTSLEGETVRLGPPDAVFHLQDGEAGLAVRAAGDAVSARLEPIFAKADADAPPPTPFAAAGATDGANPSVFTFPSPRLQAEADDALEIPLRAGTDRSRSVDAGLDIAPIIPPRGARVIRRREASIVWDLLLALLGLGFFGFGVVWGLGAEATGGPIHPMMIAWPGGLAGVGFLSVAVFRLLSRLGRQGD